MEQQNEIVATEIPSGEIEAADKNNPAQPIMSILARLHGGRLPDNLQRELRAVVREVANSGKPGKVTLELTVDKNKQFKGREIVITAAVKTKLPDDPPDSAVFFFDDGGGLHNSDPDQRPLAFNAIR